VTVHVPTHKDGSALLWEFATDSYDIAFGLFFEWTLTDEDSEDKFINYEVKKLKLFDCNVKKESQESGDTIDQQYYIVKFNHQCFHCLGLV
jgi:hypothetical protein